MKMHLPFTPGQAAAYVMLPRFIPRIQNISFRFSFVAALMAMVYGMVRILPPHHPYLNPANTGTYSVRQVFIEAARHLKFKRTHLDQVLIFFILLAATIILVVQFFMMFAYLAIGIAQAGMFVTPNPRDDIAFMLLDHVFGLPDVFGSCISDLAVTCTPTSTFVTPYEPTVFPEPHHVALHSLFGFFSVGIGMVAAAIIFYYMVAVALESAQTGVPFGNRFASVYAPIRLCLAVLMLVPLPTPWNANGVLGYNMAQYMVLQIAKTGSAFGTNGWLVFNKAFTMGGVGLAAQPGYGPGNPGGVPGGVNNTAAAALVAMPKASSVDRLLQFMFLAHTCRAMYEAMPSVDFLARDENNNLTSTLLPLKPYIIRYDGIPMELEVGTTYANALNFVKKGDIQIRFGVVPNVALKVEPFCGDLILRVGDLTSPGAAYLLESHFNLVANMWTNNAIESFGDRMAYMYLPIPSVANEICNIAVPHVAKWGEDPDTCGAGKASPFMPKVDYYNEVRNPYQALLESFIATAHEKQIESMSANLNGALLNRGWAGAGIWYNKLTQINGGLFDAARSLPDIVRMPVIMEAVARERQAATQEITAKTRYTPAGQVGRTISTYNKDIAVGLNEVYLYFQAGGITQTDLTIRSGNPIFDLMNALFGTSGLFDMRKSTDVNPMVQMTAMGKSILDAAFFNIMVGGGIELAGGILQQLGGWQQTMGGALNTLGDAWFTISMIGMGVGVILYYVVPFMPFIYFFFSVIKWVQSVFEAMIGMPLWALAHLRIDGDGIPTEAAEGGYFLLLEIFLRPILTVIGLIASFMVFTAMVHTLNDMFDLLAVNLSGYSPPSTGDMGVDLHVKRGTVDQFFYTVMYALLVYMMAVGCFKLIDLIPANILRWIGSSAKNIIDETGDPVPGLISATYIGAFGMPLINQGGILNKAVKGAHTAIEGTGQAIGETIASTAAKP